MSPIRENINEAWIEYKFSTPISRIDIQLSHWRPYSNECLDSSTGTAVVQQYVSNQWITNLDLLSDSTALPTERANIKIYTINFAVPTTQFRIYSHSFTVNTNDSNRGRICIGNIAFYPQEQYLKPTDKSSSISNSKQISFEVIILKDFNTLMMLITLNIQRKTLIIFNLIFKVCGLHITYVILVFINLMI